jgi:hypothetical protein
MRRGIAVKRDFRTSASSLGSYRGSPACAAGSSASPFSSTASVRATAVAAPTPALAPGLSPRPSRLTTFTPGDRPLSQAQTGRSLADLPAAAPAPSDAARIAARTSAAATPGNCREGGARSEGTADHASSLISPNLSAVSPLSANRRAPLASAGSSDATRTQGGSRSSATRADRGHRVAPIRRQGSAGESGAGTTNHPTHRLAGNALTSHQSPFPASPSLTKER